MTRLGAVLKENAVLIAVIAVLALGYFFLRSGASDVESLAAFDAVVAGGKPVLVEFYSDT